MSKQAYISEGQLVNDDGTPAGDITVSGALNVGGPTGVRMSYQAGAFDSLVLDGVLLTAADNDYIWAGDMQSNGTLVTGNGTDTIVPRWSLADAATQRVKWVSAIPAEWDTVAIRWGWDKEVAASGNVVWQFSYQLVDLFSGTNVNAGAVTNIAVGAIAVPASQFAFKYEVPVATEAISVPDGTFGSKPWMMCSLSRLGSDGADTYAGAVGVIGAAVARMG
jgi:hypothetical protein